MNLAQKHRSRPMEIAAKAAVAGWRGKEGDFAREFQSVESLTHLQMDTWLSQWMLSRSVPLNRRQRLLDYLNGVVIPRLRKLTPQKDNSHFEIIEQLCIQADAEGVLEGRPTSVISKLALTLHPTVFIPYDSRVQKALKKFNHRVRPHAYCEYMEAVLSHKPAFRAALRSQGLSAKSLGAGTHMNQTLFELRALDKWLMLEGGFNTQRMARDFRARKVR